MPVFFYFVEIEYIDSYFFIVELEHLTCICQTLPIKHALKAINDNVLENWYFMCLSRNNDKVYDRGEMHNI